MKPDIPIGGKSKPPPVKKVLTLLKSGLFGWKTVGRPTIPSNGNKSKRPGTSAKTVSVFENSHTNKVSKTQQNIPPKVIFGGRGAEGSTFNETQKIFTRVKPDLAGKSSTSELNTGVTVGSE